MANISSTDRTEVVGQRTDFVPPAFTLLGLTEKDRPYTACASCPSGIWFKRTEWHCFCNVMKFQPWSGDGSTPINACDARETSIADYHAKLAALQSS